MQSGAATMGQVAPHHWSGFTVRIVILLATVAMAVIEWLLFELMRLPYRPPFDMGTLLGQEINFIPWLMLLTALFWLAFLGWNFANHQFSLKDFLGFTLFIAIVLAVIVPIANHPFRPVAIEAAKNS